MNLILAYVIIRLAITTPIFFSVAPSDCLGRRRDIQRVFQIRSQRHQLFIRAYRSALRVVAMKRRFPSSVKLTKLRDWFRSGKTRAAAIDLFDAALFDIVQHLADDSQIRVQQLNEYSSKQEIEPA